MSARTPRPSGPAGGPADSPAATIAAEVHVALAALRRALAAGKGVNNDLTLQMIIDDLGVVASDLRLIERDLQEHAK